jgi:tetratricopeptide (TPR) repeat protein
MTDAFYNDEAYRLFQEAYDKQTQGSLDEAISLYQKSLEILPTAEAYTFLGWAYSYQGRYDEAIEECRKAIDLDPEYGNPYNDIGAYLIEKGQPDEAIEWLQKATEAKRYDSYCYPWYNLGRVWESKGDWGKAMQCYGAALENNAGYTLAARAYKRMQALFN